jgi:hypothetical protein
VEAPLNLPLFGDTPIPTERDEKPPEIKDITTIIEFLVTGG